jgi:hypothetical protein
LTEPLPVAPGDEGLLCFIADETACTTRLSTAPEVEA